MESNTSIDGSKFQEAKESSTSGAKLVNSAKISQNPNDNNYDMSGENILIIFNHSEFKKPKSGLFYYQTQLRDRNGTEYDVERLTQVFGNTLDHKVIVHNNLKYDEIIDTVDAFTKADHCKTSSVSVAILTHGDTGGEVNAYDRSYSLDDIFAMFEKSHKTLLGKPKLFFIQACRGSVVASGREVETDSIPRTFIIPSQADFLILYSTIEGFVSFREYNGTWMIQALCDVIVTDDSYKTTDILTIITKVNNKIAYERMSYNPKNEILHKKKQMTECRFTLTKQLYFKANN